MFVLAATGCSAAPQTPREDIGMTSSAITESTILSRADEWVQAKLLYCQSPNGADDSIDPSCPAVCMRESNAQWDPYRSDCSGFVSWSWGLPAPGRTTDEFAPADTTVSYAIDGMDLQPGDAVNIPGDHMVLFVSWQTVGSVANFYEEPGCRATPDYAHAFTSAVTISGQNVTIAYEGKTFTAIRYTGVVTGDGGAGAFPADAGTSCVVATTGAPGTCVTTTECAALGGMSTPDYCPGPDDVQCCTGLPATSSSGAQGSGLSSSEPQSSASTDGREASTAASPVASSNPSTGGLASSEQTGGGGSRRGPTSDGGLPSADAAVGESPGAGSGCSIAKGIPSSSDRSAALFGAVASLAALAALAARRRPRRPRAARL
jgi:hypothetical protein